MQEPSPKFKILITTDLYTTQTNGVVTSVKNLFDALTARGHDVRILTISDSIHSHQEGAVYYIRSMPLKGIYPDLRMPTSYRNRLIREIVRWKPDIIHSQCEFFSYQFASRISRITGAPLVHTYHTLYEQYVASYVVHSRRVGDRMVRLLSQKRLRNSAAVVAPTKKVEAALQRYGLQAPIRVVPSGISLEQHHRRLSSQDREARRAALGIRPEDQVMLNLGRLGEEKNLAELIAFFAQAHPQYENLKFLIVGDGPAREQLEQQTRQLGIAEHVIFTGMVEPDRVQEYYQLGDVFVSASTSETQGLTYIEAAANGLPLLCRQDECLDTVLETGENGFEYTDAEEFLQAIDEVFGDPDWRREAAERSREIADAFDKEHFGAKIEELYESLVS